MPDYLDVLAPLPDCDEYSIEALLFELGIQPDKAEKIWE